MGCNVPDAKLQRLTVKPKIWNLAWWFDDFDDPKWLVPKSEIHKNLLGKLISLPECALGGTQQEERDIIYNRADAYINNLIFTHNKSKESIKNP